MHDQLTAELGQLEPSVFALLDTMERTDPTEAQLRSLLSFSKKLGAFAYDIGELKAKQKQLLSISLFFVDVLTARGVWTSCWCQTKTWRPCI